MPAFNSAISDNVPLIIIDYKQRPDEGILVLHSAVVNGLSDTLAVVTQVLEDASCIMPVWSCKSEREANTRDRCG